MKVNKKLRHGMAVIMAVPADGHRVVRNNRARTFTRFGKPDHAFCCALRKPHSHAVRTSRQTDFFQSRRTADSKIQSARVTLNFDLSSRTCNVARG